MVRAWRVGSARRGLIAYLEDFPLLLAIQGREACHPRTPPSWPSSRTNRQKIAARNIKNVRDIGSLLISLLDDGINRRASQFFLLLVDGVDLGVDLAQALGELALDEG